MSDTGLTTDRLDALLSTAGHEVLAALTVEGTDLAVLTRLRNAYDADLVAAATTQVTLRARAHDRFTRAAAMFFTRAGLEQSSSERAAVRRAARLTGNVRGTVLDLCCGIGGDTIALAGRAVTVAVDRSEVHARLAVHNASVYEADARALCADVRDVPLDGVGAVHVDPARRAGGRRLAGRASEPPLAWCVGLAGSVDRVAVKVAPGLPLDTVPDGWEAEFVADGRDLLEAVLWSPTLATARTRAVVLPSGDELTSDDSHPVSGAVPTVSARQAVAGRAPVGAPGRFLLDPSPAVTRAGLVGDLAGRIDAWQIDRRIAFLSADVPITTPFARTLEVVESLPFDERTLRRLVAAHGFGTLDIRRRGLAGDVDALRRRLRPRGERRGTLVMTRVDDRPWAMLCVDAEDGPGCGR